jgi:peptide/nickel transport system permease protein
VSAYLVRRFGTSVVVVIGISVFTFLLLHAVYPSPARVVLGPRASLPAIAAWNRENGFAGSVFSQYWHYVDQVLHGNLGYSFKLNQSVAALFGERWARSAYLSGISLLLAVLIAIPLGIYQAVKRNSWGDNLATSLAFTAYAMPDFLLYLIAIQVFALTVHAFSYEASQSTSLFAVVGDWRSMTLPIICLTLLIVAGFSRYMRSSAMDTLAQDYIKAARAKGLPERLVLYRHLLRNACLPMITLVGLSIPALLAGNLIAETVFNYNGLGLLFYNSLQNEDYPVLLAYTLVGAVLTVLGNLLADIALTVADPRIRLATPGH